MVSIELPIGFETWARKAAWSDVTSYAHGERGKVEPRTWQTTFGGTTIVLTRHIDYPRDAWVVRVRGNVVREFNTPLTSKTLEDAKVEAIWRVRAWLVSILDELP